MGDYKDRSKVVIPPLPPGYVMQKVRVSYATYRVLAPHLKAEGVAPLSRLEVIVPPEEEEDE